MSKIEEIDQKVYNIELKLDLIVDAILKIDNAVEALWARERVALKEEE